MEYPELEGTPRDHGVQLLVGLSCEVHSKMQSHCFEEPERKIILVVGLDLCFDSVRANQFLF